MEMASIINQYYDAFMIKYGDTALPNHLKGNECHSSFAAHLIPVNFMCSVLIVITQNGDLCPVDTVVVQSVRTMKPASGLTDNRASYYLFPILWLLFTLPYELRSLTWHHQKEVYSILFTCVSSTLKDFGLNPKKSGSRNRYDYGVAYS